jgi:hypothetical protein
MADLDGRFRMTTPSKEDLFRHAAEAEDGMAVSAGARVAHVRLALETGRAVNVDLSDVPEERRSSLIEAIRELVRREAACAPAPGSTSAADPGKSAHP